MSTTKTTGERIDTLQEKIQQLENEKKRLLQKQKTDEKKARDHRLCKRGAYLESIVPDTIPLTDEQFYQFLDKTLKTDFARKILTQFKAQNAAEVDVEQTIPKGKNGEVTGKKSKGEQATLDGI